MPGLDSLVTYIQSKYATINALQNAIGTIKSTVNNDISNIQTETYNTEINNQQTVNNNLSSHSSHCVYVSEE